MKLNERRYKDPDYVKYMVRKAVEGSRTKRYFSYDVRGRYRRWNSSGV